MSTMPIRYLYAKLFSIKKHINFVFGITSYFTQVLYKYSQSCDQVMYRILIVYVRCAYFPIMLIQFDGYIVMHITLHVCSFIIMCIYM
jgi:hypothetical protein